MLDFDAQLICMKIQEMRSGSLHLNKKMETEGRENLFEGLTAGEPAGAAATGTGTAVAVACELDEPGWSVVSFDRREAGSLTYDQAAALISELDSAGVAGLCIITNKAATNIGD
jgi:hypothetical protein